MQSYAPGGDTNPNNNMCDSKKSLDTVRNRIDEIDQQLTLLISERARCAQEIASLKRQGSDDPNFYRPEREAEILRRVMANNPGPLAGEEMTRLFREIMSACLALEQMLSVAFLGPEGTFTQQAAYKHFGHSVRTVPLPSIADVFREVESGAAQYGVVPVENSTEGMINHTLDMFLRSRLKISGEVELRIHHHLLGTDPDLSKIERVYSHQQSLAQCREWLDSHLPGAERVSVFSNAEAARKASLEPAVAGIAGEAAGALYGLKVLKANIEDHPDNTTRFLIIGNQNVARNGRDKTSVLVSTRNRPGSLHALLDPFARHNVSLSRIESRPSHSANWEYVFFLDLVGHQEDPDLAAALSELKEDAELFRILGSYPRAVL